MFENILFQACRLFDPVVALDDVEFFCFPLAQFGDIAFVANEVRGQEHKQIRTRRGRNGGGQAGYAQGTTTGGNAEAVEYHDGKES